MILNTYIYYAWIYYPKMSSKEYKELDKYLLTGRNLNFIS